MRDRSNFDAKTILGFGEEWGTFDQTTLSEMELKTLFDNYFSLIDWSLISNYSNVMDVGCGSGRWARFIAPRAGTLHLVDPSDQALNVARQALQAFNNCVFHNVSTEDLPGQDCSFDLVYSLGVLHHIPNTQAAINDCVKKLKPGAPFLVYLYYRFDNRSKWFQILWRFTDLVRKGISRLPFFIKKRVTDLIALFVYWPLSRFGKVMGALGVNTSSFPLSFYKNSSFYTMRTDSLDRFGTRLEHRYTKSEIQQMLKTAGLVDIKFRDGEPFWCAIGYKPI